MDNTETNLTLCEEFIFNYNQKKPEVSTVGILDILRRSYHSRTEPNIHLMIQEYGKGKSHFALVIANFFKKPYNSPEVQGILSQIEAATKGKSDAILEGLRCYKQNQNHPHLVICLSGDKGGDLKKQFLTTLLNTLDAEGVKDSIAHHICSEPLQYLENLSPQDKNKAEVYLESIGNPDGDLSSLISLLKSYEVKIISTVKQISKHLINHTIDFSAEIDIESILENLIQNLCSGENRQFEGILILFDELNYYLQSWSGEPAPQNITNICEKYKGKIALLSFSQIHPSNTTSNVSRTTQAEYKKLSSRLAENTYYPESSLESVLSNLLIKKTETLNWQKFYILWKDTLRGEANSAYTKRIKRYKEKEWTHNDLYNYLAEGVFPLHPLTAYLLCNLDFTQDRTAIQFIKKDVKNWLETELVEKQGKLNYIYAITLVDSFVENFLNYRFYREFKEAQNLLASSEDPDELIVLKALFLYYASGEKLTKPDFEEHEEILTSLTGLTKSRIKNALDKLSIRNVIYYLPETKIYRFFEGTNPNTIEEQIEEKIKNKIPSLDNLVIHCNTKIETYLGDKFLIAKQFIDDNKLVGDDWKFEYHVYSIEHLSSQKTLRNFTCKGIIAFVLVETSEDLVTFRNLVNQYLEASPIKEKIVIAIPNQETGDLAKLLLKIQTLENADKRLVNVAHQETLKRWTEQLNKRIHNLFKDCTYYSILLNYISPSQQKDPNKIISALLQQLYPFVPPVAYQDKMALNSSTGSAVIGWVSCQLLTDNLIINTIPKNNAYPTVINQVFVESWRLLKRSGQKYIIQEPTQEKIKSAWDTISQMANLGNDRQKIIDLKDIWQKLSQPPYGYHQYTFTVLLAAWLGYHRKEVKLKGLVTLNNKKGSGVVAEIQSLEYWCNSDIWQKPKELIEKWVLNSSTKLIRFQRINAPVLPSSPIDYEEAKNYLNSVLEFINSADPEEINNITKDRDEVNNCVKQIDKWFSPVEKAENIKTGTSDPEKEFTPLLTLYPQLLLDPSISSPDIISVKPTLEQITRRTQALQKVRDRIEALIITESNRSDTLQNENDCNSHKQLIEQMIEKVNKVSDLPPHLTEILHRALITIEYTQTRLQEQANQQKYLREIKQLYSQLNGNSTQADYKQISTIISSLAWQFPKDSDKALEVQQILQKIEQSYQELCQQIESWEERTSSVNSEKQISDLINEIDRQKERFTEESSQSRLKRLEEQLDRELKQQLDKKQQQDEDSKVMREINQLKSTNKMTVHQCEEGIKRVEELSLKLHHPESFNSEIEQVLENLNDKITCYQEELDNLRTSLSKINNLKDVENFSINYIRRAYCFEDSSLYSTYEILDQEITELLESMKMKDKEAQIISLFQGLPKLKRQDLYKQLEKFLTDDDGEI